MVAIVIIGLVIAVWVLNDSANTAKSQLKIERGRKYNFVELLYLLKKSDSDYREEQSRFNHKLIVKRTTNGYKSFSVSASDGILYVTFILKISYKTECRYFRYSIYDRPSVVSAKVLSESKDFEEKFLNDNPTLKPTPIR